MQVIKSEGKAYTFTQMDEINLASEPIASKGMDTG
jgi:hypothetical protein